jgi:hypothetical protein
VNLILIIAACPAVLLGSDIANDPAGAALRCSVQMADGTRHQGDLNIHFD